MYVCVRMCVCLYVWRRKKGKKVGGSKEQKSEQVKDNNPLNVRTTISLLSRLILVKSGTIIFSPTTTPYDKTKMIINQEKKN